MNTSIRPYTLSIRFVVAVLLVAAVALLWPSKAYAENVNTTIMATGNVEAVVPTFSGKKSPVQHCKTARCEEKVMAAMANIVIKAKDKPTSGLTYDNCAKAQLKFVRLGQQLKPATLDAFMKKNAWVGECAFYVPPSVNF